MIAVLAQCATILALVVRVVRGYWRRWRYPKGPPWGRLSCINVIMALHDCSFEEAARRDNELARARREAWLNGD